MPPDHDRDEPAAFGAPLPPEDRLWRHPSELVDDSAKANDTRAGSTAATAGGYGGRRGRTGTTAGLALLTGLAGAALVIVVMAATGHLDSPVATQTVTDAAQATPVSLAAASVDESVMPTVAHLTVSIEDGRTSASAVVYRADGYLLTTAQAVSDNVGITVVLADGRSLPATTVGIDPATGVAVLHVHASDLQPAPLGRSSLLRVGDPALTIGAPAGSGSGTLTDGVVSALGRSMSLDDASLYDLIATDRAVPTDSDGGAMVDASGKVTGLCVSIPAATGQAPAGFAVPIDVVIDVADQLIATGRAEHGWLGVSGSDLAPDAARRLGIQGVQLSTVEPRSPAAEAGLRAGDIVMAVDRTPVASMAQLVGIALSHGPGARVSLEYLRGIRHATTTVVLGRSFG